MKRLLRLVMLGGLLVVAQNATAAKPGWTTDLEGAKSQAKEKNRDILLNFTGSDWCGYCIRLNEEVFSKKKFADWAAKKLVLVELDFPKDASKLSAETIRQNESLQARYLPKGFPTLYFCDAAGRPYARVGYTPDLAGNYIAIFETLLKIRVKRDNALAEAGKAAGVSRAGLLVSSLKVMNLPRNLEAEFYPDVMKEIVALDPKDETGFALSWRNKEKLELFQAKLDQFARAGKISEALQLTDTTVAEAGWSSGQVQDLHLTRAILLADLKRFPESLGALDAAEKVDPRSELMKEIEIVRTKIKAAKKQAAEGLY